MAYTKRSLSIHRLSKGSTFQGKSGVLQNLMVHVIELFGRMETTYECLFKDVSRVCTLQINTFIVQIETFFPLIKYS